MLPLANPVSVPPAPVLSVPVPVPVLALPAAPTRAEVPLSLRRSLERWAAMVNRQPAGSVLHTAALRELRGTAALLAGRYFRIWPEEAVALDRVGFTRGFAEIYLKQSTP